MIKEIQPKHIEKINAVATELMAHLKKNKTTLVRPAYKERIGASVELFRVTRLIDGTDKYQSIETTTDAAFKELAKLVNKLVELLPKKSAYKYYKLSDYTKPDVLVKKISRDLVSDLEDMYVLGEVTKEDIEQVYSNLGKQPAKKFKFFSLNGADKKVYAAISLAIRSESQGIKQSTIAHYKALVEKLDPNNEAASESDFIKLARKRLSDLSAIRLCVAFKFDNKRFESIVDDEFESLIAFAAVRIIDHCNATETPDVKVTRVKVGGKGFDVELSVNGKHLSARAVPVEGCYVRFHYRYIIT